MANLGTLSQASFSQSHARAVNDSGQVVGWSNLNPDFHAVGWQPVTGDLGSFHAISDLGDLPGGANQSEAYGVNDLGQVVGRSSASGNGGPDGFHAFLWDGVNGMTDLGDLPGGRDYSFATGINNSRSGGGGCRCRGFEREGFCGLPVTACWICMVCSSIPQV